MKKPWPLDYVLRIGRAYGRWFLLVAGLLLATRLTSLTASCWLDASQTCRDWFFYGIIGPLRFQWVAKYKELLAGILAAAAGIFVLLAARMQIAEQRDRLAKDERKRLIGLIHRLEMDLFRAANAITYRFPMDRMNFEDPRAATAEITMISGEHGAFLDVAHFIARTEAARAQDNADNGERPLGALYAVIGHVICSRIRQCISEEKPQQYGPLRAPLIVDIARRVGATISDLEKFSFHCDVKWTLQQMNAPGET